MPPRNFCDIDSKYYLFGKSDTPEEKVRQWMIFELLAVYNVPVQAISIESPVKVGTRSHYADILILKEYRPWAVIECKRQEDSDISSGIQQAVSYASCLQAEFAAFTNGTDWLVKRFHAGQWFSVPDFPSYSARNHSRVKLRQLSSSYRGLFLLVRWIHQHSSNLESRDFLLTALERFADQLPLIFDSNSMLLWSNFLGDFIKFFKEPGWSRCENSSGFAQNEEGYKGFVRLFISLTRYYEKIDMRFNFEFLNIPAVRLSSCCSSSLDEILDSYHRDPGLIGEISDLFTLYIDTLNKRYEDLPGLEPILIKLIHYLTRHFYFEMSCAQKIPIPNADIKLNLILIELIKFIFEDHFCVSIPCLLEEKESGDWESIYEDLGEEI
ncbi:MAG: hypothetical protein BJG00_001895 [Limnothrix sp. CACIAM 69d]|nr:MAG: hypothetical protein BJG00_001895 [Limnothrix sp. CACIAM 69d]